MPRDPITYTAADCARDAVINDAMARQEAIDRAIEALRGKIRAVIEEFADVVDDRALRSHFERAEIPLILDYIVEQVEDAAARVTHDLRDVALREGIHGEAA